ncbi:hypothetical protein HPB48_004277 [Haemaphysalis longicornis]|uniref:CCHC-type domain-containing protein n=1 Tax=Haemaphysalis longicornis TaxID=44386 RepID=A0A9J6GRC0_HAELO|nr:hypothetical protein HPB48_004277 [Haemaphysalis longicornis]
MTRRRTSSRASFTRETLPPCMHGAWAAPTLPLLNFPVTEFLILCTTGKAEYRCYIHKRKHEVCSSCGRLGHRMYVCPSPDRAFCSSCGLANPMDQHVCTVKCALCGKDHVTGDKQCKKRYRTAFIVKQRHWRRELEHSRDAGDARLQRDRSASFPRLSRAETPSNTVPRRDDNRAQAQRQSRSQSKKRGSDKGRAAHLRDQSSTRTPAATSQVSLAAKASHIRNSGAHTFALPSQTPPDTTPAVLNSIRATLEQVMAENRQLQAELAQLKSSSTPTRDYRKAAHNTAFTILRIQRFPPKRRAQESADQQPTGQHVLYALEVKLEKELDQHFDKLNHSITTLAGAFANFREMIRGKVTALEYTLVQAQNNPTGLVHPSIFTSTEEPHTSATIQEVVSGQNIE